MLLTVYFEGRFWVALAEQLDADGLRAARHIFGEEPSDAAVHTFVLDDLFPLLDRATVTVDAEPMSERKRNPKRAAREAARALAAHGGSTEAQEAMRLQLEAHKRERIVRGRAARDAAEVDKREIARRKAKERQRGH